MDVYEVSISNYLSLIQNNIKKVQQNQINLQVEMENIDKGFVCYDTSVSLKLVSAIFYQIFIFSSNDSPSKTMKNVFYFI